MKTMMTPETINEIHAEDAVYYKWLNEQKNRILRMTDYKKKQAEWSKLFTPYTPDDSYLLGNQF